MIPVINGNMEGTPVTPQKQSDKIWSFVGKASLALTLILGILALVRECRGPDNPYHLTAKINTYDSQIFPPLKANVAGLGEKFTKENFDKILGEAAYLKDADKYTLTMSASILSHFVGGQIRPLESAVNYGYPRGKADIVLKNDGKATAENIRVTIDGFEFAWLTLPGAERIPIESAPIEIKKMHRGDQVTINCWTSVLGSAEYSISVTYDQGVVSREFLGEYTERKPISFFWTVIVPPIIGLAVIALTAFGVTGYRAMTELDKYERAAKNKTKGS